VSRPAPEAPRVQPQPQPRYEQPRNDQPRYEPRNDQPRYEQPRDDSGRREGPRLGQPGVDAPRGDASNNGPRYLPPDNSGRTPDRGRSTNGGIEGGLSRGRTGSDANDDTDSGRVWQPDGGGAYAFERRAPRTPVPSLAGTRRLDGNVPGTPRPGLSSRTGRSPDFGATRPAPGTTEGEGVVRLPRSEVTRESILQRYRGRANADLVLPKRTPGGTELSRARGVSIASESTPKFDERARAAREKATTVAPRGSVEAARRQRESLDRLDRLRRDAPWRAQPIEDTGRALATASDRAAQLSIGLGVGFATGVYAGWFWEPSCSPHHAAPYSHWAATYGWPWSYYGSCSYWPFGFGLSWHHGNWGFGWNSYSYGYPYSYSNWYPYSYAYWSPAPVYYTTVVNDRYDDVTYVVYQEPEVRGEGVIIANDADERSVRDVPREPSPEVKQVLVRGASEYLTLGDEAFRQGRYSDAVHHYARTVEYAPGDGVLYLLLSDALFATGDYHYAAFALRRAVELEPRLLDNVIDKHGYYGDPAEFDKQIALAEQYLNEHFLDEDARLVLAANYLFANRPAQCVDLLLSPFSQAVLESTAGRRIYERAELLRKAGNPAQR